MTDVLKLWPQRSVGFETPAQCLKCLVGNREMRYPGPQCIVVMAIKGAQE